MRKHERIIRNRKIIRMIESGQYSLEEIGEKFGLTASAVHYIYKRR